MNNFNTMADISNIKGIEAIKEYLYELNFTDNDFRIDISKDKYSPFDVVLFVGEQIIPIEIKYRDKKYDTLMMECKKAKALTTIKGTDHWYVNVFKSGESPVIFSMNKLRKCDTIHIDKEVNISATDVKGNVIKSAYIRANKYTAVDDGKILKRCWFFPIELKIN